MKKKCNFCGNLLIKIKLSLPLFRHLDFKTVSDNFNLDKCTRCGVIKNNNVRSSEKNLFMSNLYLKSDQTSQKVIKNNKSKKNGRPYFQAKIISKLLKNHKNPSILDIGCFDGKLLYELCHLIKNCNLIGCDINPKLRNYFTKKKNIEFYSRGINKIDRKFDMIIFSHSIMYIENLKSLMIKLSLKLKKNGMIFIQVPNLESNPFYALMGDQYQTFTKNSLINILNICGYKCKLIKDRYFPKELIFLSKKKISKIMKFKKDNTFDDSIDKINNVKNMLTFLTKKKFYTIFGTTVNAAFAHEILKENIIYFVDENIGSYNKIFRGLNVYYPTKLNNSKITLLPYGKNFKKVFYKLQKIYYGKFKLI